MKCYFIFLILFLLFFCCLCRPRPSSLLYKLLNPMQTHRTSNTKMKRLWLRLRLLPWPVPRPVSDLFFFCIWCCWVQHTQTIVERGDTYAVGVNYNNSELQPFFYSLLLSLAWVASLPLPSLVCVAVAIKANKLTKSPFRPPLANAHAEQLREACAKMAKKKWPTWQRWHATLNAKTGQRWC